MEHKSRIFDPKTIVFILVTSSSQPSDVVFVETSSLRLISSCIMSRPALSFAETGWSTWSSPESGGDGGTMPLVWLSEIIETTSGGASACNIY